MTERPSGRERRADHVEVIRRHEIRAHRHCAGVDSATVDDNTCRHPRGDRFECLGQRGVRGELGVREAPPERLLIRDSSNLHERGIVRHTRSRPGEYPGDHGEHTAAEPDAQSERENALSEQDVVNVLELVLNEYPVDPDARFLFGHSMGSGGTWYIGGKYATYWRGLAPMSGPFVQEEGYPWDAVRPLSLLVTEGARAPSLAASKLLADWLTKNGFTSRYQEVDADHGGMVSLVLPAVFQFFDAARTN